MKANARIFGTVLALGAGALVLRPASALASGYEFDGVGARAVARGGAVIADAPDWTAIYWNPANLTDVTRRQAGLELKAGKSYTHDGDSFDINGAGGIFSKKNGGSSFFFGSAGAVTPLTDGSALGFGVYLPLLQGADFSDDRPLSPGFSGIDYKGHLGIAVANVSYARRLTGRLSGAVGLDLVYGALSSDLDLGYYLPGPTPDTLKRKLEGDGFGVEGVLGAKYKVSDRLSLGAVFRSGARVDIKGDAKASDVYGGSESTDFKFLLKQPPTSGVGAAWRYRSDLTFTCDFTQTWWRGFSDKTTYAQQGPLLSDTPNTFDWKNSWKLRAGALWNYSRDTDLMFGYAYDTPAIDARSLDLSTAVDVPMHRVSAAVSHRWGDVEGTLAGLGGYNTRTAGGVHYSLGGWYFLGELTYTF